MIETIMNIFERASRKKIRFAYKGNLSVEDLWDLSVQELDEMFKKLNKKLRDETGSESLLGHSDEEGNLSEIELQVAIIRHIVKVKLEEAASAEQEVTRRQKKQKILEIIARKEDASLEGKSEEELSKMLDEL